ncbi:MAG: ribonuclease III family protein [Promethearchaeota archaeon]
MPLDQKNIVFQEFNLHWNLQLPLPLLVEALTHPSFKSVDPDASDNQRLETLGDSVIDLLVIEWLYNNDLQNEGILTKKRADLVQNTTLATIGNDLQIATVLRCAPAYQIQEKDLADTVEAIFGAIYISNGLEACRNLLLHLFNDELQRVLRLNNSISLPGHNEANPKNQLQEFFQQHGLPEPSYHLHKKQGDDHNPRYWYSCKGIYKNHVLVGKGVGKSKKDAQMKAAYDLLKQLKQLEL